MVSSDSHHLVFIPCVVPFHIVPEVVPMTNNKAELVMCYCRDLVIKNYDFILLSSLLLTPSSQL